MFVKPSWFRTLLFTALLSSLCGVVAHAQTKSIWRIGEFNNSSTEFRDNLDYTNPSSDVMYEIGKQAPGDWPRFQPGPANGMTGGRLHPYTIVFNLDHAPAGTYTLNLAVLYETPRMSYLKLEVNGHSGLFYFHPTLDYNAGDWEGTFVPQTSCATKSIAIPAEWLKSGENRFVLTAMDSPAEKQSSLGAIAPGHTGIVYDALELVRDVQNAKQKQIGAIVEPTIFYVQRNGKLQEIVDVFVDAATPLRSVELRLGSFTARRSSSDKSVFGEHRVSFEVPEWSGSMSATVAVTTTTGKKSIRATLTPAKKWNIAVIPNEHLDIGFTDYPAKVAELHAQSIDDAMAIMKRRPEFRWTLDGAWVANQYMAARSPEAQKEFLDHVRDGSVVIPLEFDNQHTGNASFEGLARNLYDAHAQERKFNLPRSLAAHTIDVPTYTWALPSVLHDAGIKYFVGASNSWRAPGMLFGRWNEKSPFYWEGPDGGRVMMWYARAYLQMHTLFGSPWQMEAVRDSLPVFLQAYTRTDYISNTAIIFGSQLENTPLAPEQADLQATWNSQYAYPHFEFSTVQTAMEKIEKEFGGKISVYKGDFGPYWEDGYGSDAVHTAIHRRNQERILTAEKMSVLPSLLSSTLRPDSVELKKAWNNELLFDEHTWTYVGATSQPENQQTEDQTALKQSRVIEAQRQINESIQRSWSQLGSFIVAPQSSVAVFNSLNWKRSGIVSVDLPDNTEIYDVSAKQVVPYEVLSVGKGYKLPGFGGGYRRVRFRAQNVPELGYKLFALRSTSTELSSPSISESSVVENQFYRVTVDPSSASIRKVVDKQLGRELVDQQSPYRFGALLCVTGAEDYPNNSLYRYGVSLPRPKLHTHALDGGKLLGVRRTPYGSVIEMSATSEAFGPVRVTITLYDAQKKIDLRVDFHKDRQLNRESAYIAFPTNVESPTFTYGNQTGWVNPAKDELPGGSREWYVARHWFTAADAHSAVTITPIDAPLVTFGDVVRGEWPLEFKPKSSTMFSWLMNNYWGTNFPAWQGGDFTFRYSLTSGDKLDPVQAERFGLEAMVPLETTSVSAGIGNSPLPVSTASFLDISGADVALSTWKPAEDGDGSILRIQELAGKAGTVYLRSDYVGFTQAWTASVLEENRSELRSNEGQIEVAIQPFQTLTLRVHTTAKRPGRVAAENVDRNKSEAN